MRALGFVNFLKRKREKLEEDARMEFDRRKSMATGEFTRRERRTWIWLNIAVTQ
jgi:hypothetical protein